MRLTLVFHLNVTATVNVQGVNQKLFIGAAKNKLGNSEVHKCYQIVKMLKLGTGMLSPKIHINFFEIKSF